jgi:hypothetical protein
MNRFLNYFRKNAITTVTGVVILAGVGREVYRNPDALLDMEAKARITAEITAGGLLIAGRDPKPPKPESSDDPADTPK